MKTVKQVSDLTGISVRTLHYYDEIGLLKPSEITDTGYRMYDNEALRVLQQILFFKELDMPLKDIKEIMLSPYFEKIQALKNQKKLLMLKRDRLNNIIKLIDKTLKGDCEMSFKEFDMSEYFKVLEKFKEENEDKVIKMYGSLDKYDEFIDKCRDKEKEITNMAIKQYGSIEKYTQSVKENLNNSGMFNLAEQYDKFKRDFLEDKHPKLKELFGKLTADLTKDTSSNEIQQIAGEITNISKNDYEAFSNDRGDECWYYMVNLFGIPIWAKEVDKKYSDGSSKFIAEALKKYLGYKKPKIEELYEELVSDLSKDPYSNEVQKIVKIIWDETKKNSEFFKMNTGENHLGYMAELYLENHEVIKVNDDKYGTGASKFIGGALKFYSENK